MAYFKFPSLAHPEKYGYAYDTGRYSSRVETNEYFRQFETCGDGMTQHSPCWPVTFDFLTDYCGSLAEAMLSNPELVRQVSYCFRAERDAELIEWASTVVWKESDSSYTKRRYVSVSLKKVASQSRAEHDKRYVEINKYMDGSCASIMRLICSEYTNGFERYQKHEAVRIWSTKQKKHPGWGEGWPEYFDGDWHKNNALRAAVRACRLLVDSIEARDHAESCVDGIKRELKWKAEAEAEAEAERVAALVPSE